MNLRHPFDQLIAGKLRQLPAPDADASWQQMKRLLDEEDHRGAGGKRPPGNGGWWWIGIMAIVLSAGFWIFVEKNNAPHPQLAATNANSIDNKNISIDNNTTLPVTNTPASIESNKTNSGTNRLSNPAATSTAPGAGKAAAAAALTENGFSSTSPGTTIKGLAKTSGHQQDMEAAATNDNIAVTVTKKNKSYNAQGYRAKQIRNNETAAAKEQFAATHEYVSSSFNAVNNPVKKKGRRTISADDGQTGADAITPFNGVPAKQTTAQKTQTWLEQLTGLRSNAPLYAFDGSRAAGDSMAGNRKLALNNDTKNEVIRTQRDNAAAIADKKEKKQLHLNLSNLFKPFSLHADAEPWWAAGLAVNGNVTVGAQNRFNYNMNAKSGTITDYIPSPYLQYHVNNYVYLQTEINLITPQYTPQLLVYQQSNDISAQVAGTSRQKSIFVQKLYYFNLPLSLHYSPISNLYFSAGIQFSSFQSGLASIVEKEYATTAGADHPTSTSNTLLKFKDDSIAAKIAPNEWRWQAGAEYYWNRFSVGLRYNQAFKNAINTTVAASLPPTVNRNQSLLFFVRYNLFESRSKSSVPKNE